MWVKELTPKQVLAVALPVVLRAGEKCELGLASPAQRSNCRPGTKPVPRAYVLCLATNEFGGEVQSVAPTLVPVKAWGPGQDRSARCPQAGAELPPGRLIPSDSAGLASASKPTCVEITSFTIGVSLRDQMSCAFI
jgi:hypothetical protein